MAPEDFRLSECAQIGTAMKIPQCQHSKITYLCRLKRSSHLHEEYP